MKKERSKIPPVHDNTMTFFPEILGHECEETQPDIFIHLYMHLMLPNVMDYKR